MTWKDDHQEHKNETGLTWHEYHQRHFVHVDELDGMTESIKDLREHVEAVTNEYRQMKRELHEVRVLLASEEYEP